jgi:UDP-N-acetylglucosamine 2-epimerase
MAGHAVFHVEAGLRSHDVDSPFPEELNRRLIAGIADLHFAPTVGAKNNLLSEGYAEDTIEIVGNTGIDTLIQTAEKVRSREAIAPEVGSFVLITMHRRENWENGVEKLSRAIKLISNSFPSQKFVFCMHPNPELRLQVQKYFEPLENVKLIPSPKYSEMIQLLVECDFVLSDSGGIQEEATTLRKPIGILREHTERPEALQFRENKLLGTDVESIVNYAISIKELLASNTPNATYRDTFGDGHAAARIVDKLLEWAGNEN